MKVGDLVRRRYVTETQRQRVLSFDNRISDIGLITEIDKKEKTCYVLFHGEGSPRSIPMDENYLEIISEQKRSDQDSK